MCFGIQFYIHHSVGVFLFSLKNVKSVVPYGLKIHKNVVRYSLFREKVTYLVY
jgi:hypothetical protein